MIPPLNTSLRISGDKGVVEKDFHRWLGLVSRALRGPFIGTRVSGTFAITDSEFGVIGKRLELLSKDRASILSDGRLVICG